MKRVVVRQSYSSVDFSKVEPPRGFFGWIKRVWRRLFGGSYKPITREDLYGREK